MQKLWFRAKEYGYGWYPVTWQGWVVILGYFAVLVLLIYVFNTNVEKFLYYYLGSVFIITAVLIYICYKTGEKPSWRWGKKK